MKQNQQGSRLVLASQSPVRAGLLRSAGLAFETRPAHVDEAALIADCAGLEVSDTALRLAEAKAAAAARTTGDAAVIAADQVLEFEGTILQKPADIQAARDRLLAFAGKAHRLVTAVVLARAGEVIWRHVETAQLTLHELTEIEVDQLLALEGKAVLQSVGAYRLEGPGISMFKALEGDYFAMLGLPLVPLLAAIRQHVPQFLPGAQPS